MILTNASYRLVDEPNPTKKIEQIARICYKSEDKIGDGTDIAMIKNLIERKHTAMLEHASVVLEVSEELYKAIQASVRHRMSAITASQINNTDTKVNKREYLRFSTTKETRDETTEKRFVISGNLRAWYDYFDYLNSYGAATNTVIFNLVNQAANNIFDCFKDSLKFECGEYGSGRVINDLSVLTVRERMIHEDFTVVFTVDRGVTHELVRMREASFAQESTRYCNYSKDKFGKEITFIKPCFETWNEYKYKLWEEACSCAEKMYFSLIDDGAKPQEARDVLPVSVKSDIAVTANLNEWYHIFNLRACDATGPAHPQMKEVMIPLLKEERELRPDAFGGLKLADEK